VDAEAPARCGKQLTQGQFQHPDVKATRSSGRENSVRQGVADDTGSVLLEPVHLSDIVTASRCDRVNAVVQSCVDVAAAHDSVAAQVQQGLLAITHELAVDHPDLRQLGRQAQTGVLYSFEQLGAEDLD